MSNLFKSSNSLPAWPKGRLRPLTLLGALALASASLETRAAPPSESAAKTVRVVVDASALGDDSAYFETEIKRQLSEGLTAEGFEVVEAGGSTVRLKLSYFDERDRDFLISTDVVREGRMAVSQKPATCPACVDDEVVEAAVAILPEVIEVLRADPQHLPPEGSNEPPPGDGDGDGDVDDPPVQPTPKPIGPVGFAGIGVAVVGLGVTIGGAVELSRGRVYEHREGYRDVTGTDHRPVGYALIGAGAAATVAGLVMLGVDAGRRAKQRKQTRTHVLIIPSISPASAGVGVVGRF